MEGEERKGEYEGSSISMHSWQPGCSRVPGRRCAQASHLGSKQPISLASGHAIRGCHLMTSLIQSNLSSFVEAPRNELSKLILLRCNAKFSVPLSIVRLPIPNILSHLSETQSYTSNYIPWWWLKSHHSISSKPRWKQLLLANPPPPTNPIDFLIFLWTKWKNFFSLIHHLNPIPPKNPPYYLYYLKWRCKKWPPQKNQQKM